MNDFSTVTRTVQPDGTTETDIDTLLGAEPAKPWYKRKWLIGALAVALLALLLIWTSLGGSAAGGYATEAARRENLTVTVSATGNLQPTNQVEVGSEQSGLVEAVYADNNDRVIKGQPLARLDTSRLRDTLAQAQATLNAAQATVSQNQATASQASANLGRLQQVYELSGGKVPARSELDTARAEAQRAQAGIRSGQAQVASARAQVSSAQTNLSKATIYSPVNGVVLSRSVDPGQTVAASLSAPTLFTLAEDLSSMELNVSVDEADVGQVQAGQKAEFRVDAYPGRTFNATLKRVDLGANASSGGGTSATTSTSNVVAYTAVLTVANPDLLLRPGMTATAEIVTSAKPNVLVVPNAALRFRPTTGAGQSGGVTSMLVPRGPRGDQTSRTATAGRGSSQTVYVENAEGQPEARQISVGSTDGQVTEVTSGQLKAGEKVITGQLANASSGGSGGPPRQAALLPLLAVLPGRRRRA